MNQTLSGRDLCRRPADGGRGVGPNCHGRWQCVQRPGRRHRGRRRDAQGAAAAGRSGHARQHARHGPRPDDDVGGERHVHVRAGAAWPVRPAGRCGRVRAVVAGGHGRQPAADPDGGARAARGAGGAAVGRGHDGVGQRPGGAARPHQDARAAPHRSRIRHGAVGARDARQADRGLRRQERQRARRAGPGRGEEGHLPARTRLSPAVAQREARAGVRATQNAKNIADRRQRGQRHAVRAARPRATRSTGRQPRLSARVGRPVLFRRPGAVHELLRRHRRPERRAARRGDSGADAAQQLHRAPRAPERGERARGVAAHRALLAEARP